MIAAMSYISIHTLVLPTLTAQLDCKASRAGFTHASRSTISKSNGKGQEQSRLRFAFSICSPRFMPDQVPQEEKKHIGVERLRSGGKECDRRAAQYKAKLEPSYIVFTYCDHLTLPHQ